MSQIIRRLTFLGNFGRLNNASGQIATLLILLTVIMLIFTLITLNIGNVAVSSTALSNAADTSALYLASQLATKSRQIYDAIPGYEQCQKTGWLSTILAVVVAVVAIALTAGAASGAAFSLASSAISQVSMLTLAGAGAVGGFVGGAVGGTLMGMSGDQVWKAGFSGAAIGAAIGTMAGGLAGSTVGGGATTTTTATGTLEAPVAFENVSAIASVGQNFVAVTQGTTTTLIGTASVTVPAMAGASSVALGALSTLASGYNQAVSGSMNVDIANQFTKMMNRLSEPDRIRESTFMRALQMVVDDPNKSQDLQDSNLNGNTTELVPDFQRWMFNRIDNADKLAGGGMTSSDISSFLGGPAYAFSLFSKLVNEGGSYWEYFGGGLMYANTNGVLERSDYKLERTEVPDPEYPGETIMVDQAMANPDGDGKIITLLRGLWDMGRPLRYPEAEDGGALRYIWEPGPTPEEMEQWAIEVAGAGEMEVPLEVPGYDPVDQMADGLREIGYFIDDLRAMPEDQVITSWQAWSTFFHDKDFADNPTAYYNVLTAYHNRMTQWQTEIIRFRNSLPSCLMGGAGGDIIMNAPCRFEANPEMPGGSIDADVDDEFGEALTDIHHSLDKIRDFTQLINFYMNYVDPDYSFYGESCGSFNGEPKSCGGKNPVIYTWSDSRGAHSVTVRTTFSVPRTITEKRGNWLSGKVCVKLINHRDTASQPCQVIVSRWDSIASMDFLGRWNPFGGRVTKAAKGTYYDTGGGHWTVALK